MQDVIEFVRDYYQTEAFVPLHVPSFVGNEQKYVTETIKSSFVSSVGKYVDQFEEQIANYCGSEAAVAVVNGTSALQVALRIAGVKHNDLVITQSLNFVAGCNAIAHNGAEPVFVDISESTLGMSPEDLRDWLEENCEIDGEGFCRHFQTGKRVMACVPMHTFGHPLEIEDIADICQLWKLALIEDVAEGLGSFKEGRHIGNYGLMGAFSFNGNKTITTGGGGMLVSNSATAQKAKHLTTTAKIPHAYEYIHDEIGYNFRMPNLNAALGCAQMESLKDLLSHKRDLAMAYKNFFQGSQYEFVDEPEGCQSNFWLNAILCEDKAERDNFLETTNNAGVMTRPAWQPMHSLDIFSNCLSGPMSVTEMIANRLVNIPSSPKSAIKKTG